MQLIPALVTALSLPLFKNALLSLILLHAIAYLYVPYYYIKKISKEKLFTPFFLNEFRDRKYQIKKGSSLFMAAFTVIFMAYFFIYEFRTKIIYMLDIPMSYNPFYMIAFIFLMAFVNPILEEWFWRVFLGKLRYI